nr:Gap3.3 [Starmerella bombicola]
MEKSEEPVSISGEVISNPNSEEISFGPTAKKRNIFTRILHSYMPPEDDYKFEHMTPQEKAAMYLNRSTPQLSRRHLIVISLSSCVGTGLFIGSGDSLRNAGAAGLLLAFIIMGIALLCTMATVGELSLRYPTVSVFYEIPARFMHPSWGFAVGWLYAFCWMVTVPLEIIAGAELTQYWRSDGSAAARVNPVAWAALLYVFDVVINLAGSRVYGELEFGVGFIKVTAMFGFILFALINVCGGPPTDHYIGSSVWYDPSPFKNSFKGFVTAITSCAFAYGGTEVSGIASAETANPVKSIPSAVRQAFWRILIFFVIAVLFMTLLVSSNNQTIGNSSSGSGSPFIAAIKQTGVRALPSIFNSVIICSVIGVSNAAVYAASRTVTSLAIKGAAPKPFCYIDRKGRPLWSLVFVLTFALLCFVCASDKYNDVFNWLYAFAQLAFLFAWASVCFCHLRFRYALKIQGRSTSELIYTSPLGIWGSLLAGFIIIATLSLQVWIYLFPIGKSPSASTFFQGDLSIPVFLALLIGHKLWYWRTSKFVATKDLDLDSGVRDIDYQALQAEIEKDRELNRRNPLRRIASHLC